jgi:hypothetical protein
LTPPSHRRPTAVFTPRVGARVVVVVVVRAIIALASYV